MFNRIINRKNMDNILVLILGVNIKELYPDDLANLYDPIMPLGDLIIVSLDHPFFKTNAHQHSAIRCFG